MVTRIFYSPLTVAGSTYKIVYYPNIGNGTVDFNAPIELVDLGGGTNAARPSVAAIDLDGDGLIDFAHMVPGIANIYFSQLNSNGVLSVIKYSSTSLGLTPNADKALLADLNGDGLKDHVFVNNASSSLRKWHVQLNKGNRTFAAKQSLNTDVGLADMYSYPAGVPEYDRVEKNGRVSAADLDGDGAEELLVATHTTDDFQVVVFGERLELLSGKYLDDMEMCVKNDELYVKKAYSMSCGIPGDGEEISIDYSQYDIRRFYWSVVDFKTVDQELTHARTIGNVAHRAFEWF